MAVDKKELWAGWTRDAMSRYQPPENVDSTDELVDDMSEVATTYADEMLDQFEERFEGNRGGGRKRGRRQRGGGGEEPER